MAHVSQALFWARTYNWRFCDYRDEDFATLGLVYEAIQARFDARFGCCAPSLSPTANAHGLGAATRPAAGERDEDDDDEDDAMAFGASAIGGAAFSAEPDEVDGPTWYRAAVAAGEYDATDSEDYDDDERPNAGVSGAAERHDSEDYDDEKGYDDDERPNTDAPNDMECILDRTSMSRIDMLKTTLRQLIASKPHGFDQSYDTLFRACKNPLVHPGVPKYTTLKLDDQIICKNVLSGVGHGGLEFLIAAGALGWLSYQ